jgi:hypothetical protein
VLFIGRVNKKKEADYFTLAEKHIIIIIANPVSPAAQAAHPSTHPSHSLLVNTIFPPTRSSYLQCQHQPPNCCQTPGPASHPHRHCSAGERSRGLAGGAGRRDGGSIAAREGSLGSGSGSGRFGFGRSGGGGRGWSAGCAREGHADGGTEGLGERESFCEVSAWSNRTQRESVNTYSGHHRADRPSARSRRRSAGTRWPSKCT